MTLQDRVAAARRFDLSRFLPFVVDGVALGHVRRDLSSELRHFPTVFTIDEAALGLHPDLDSCERRSAAMAVVARTLSARGRLTPWRNETYDISAAEGAAVAFVIERAAVRFFGLTAHAVHVNGLVEEGGETSMWIARRSPAKGVDPGMLDTMVGGGLASGLSIADTVAKEAWEEAGIPQSLARTACAAGTLRVLREVPQGLHHEVLHVYDLLLPGDFIPENQDGEVAEFRRLSLQALRQELDGDAAYTVDAGLVAIDCLERRAQAVTTVLNNPH